VLWVAKGLASNAGPRGCFTTRFASTVSAPDMVTRAAFLVGMRGGRFGFQAWGRAPIAPCFASPYEGPSDSINHRAGAGGYASYPLAAGPSPISSGDAHEWYVPGHAYTVLEVDPATRKITLRNPWGHQPDPDGVFSIPIETFLETFPMVATIVDEK